MDIRHQPLISSSLRRNLLQDLSSLGGVMNLLILIVGIAFFRKDLGLQLFVGCVVVMVAGYLIKIFFPTKRPDHFERQQGKGLADEIDFSSFPSIHSSRATITAIILFPLGGLFFQIFILLIALAIMISRVILKRHHVKDVIGGAVIGIIAGLLVNRFL